MPHPQIPAGTAVHVFGTRWHGRFDVPSPDGIFLSPVTALASCPCASYPCASCPLVLCASGLLPSRLVAVRPSCPRALVPSCVMPCVRLASRACLLPLLPRACCLVLCICVCDVGFVAPRVRIARHAFACFAPSCLVPRALCPHALSWFIPRALVRCDVSRNALRLTAERMGPEKSPAPLTWPVLKVYLWVRLLQPGK